MALELSGVSNGWFRYLMDGKVATVYSSGNVESGLDPFEGTTDFVEKMKHCCLQVPKGSSIKNILSYPSPLRLMIGNWSLICQREGELAIHNSDGSQVLITTITILVAMQLFFSCCFYHCCFTKIFKYTFNTT